MAFAPDDYYMRVPQDLLNSVVFIGQRKSDQKGRESLRFGGTAFVVSVPDESDPQSRFFYLVTARHCIDNMFSYSPNIEIRYNTKDGDWRLVQSKESDWIFHPFEAACVDVAVARFSPGADFLGTHILSSCFLTDEAIKIGRIGPGDEVAIVGLFTKLEGRSKDIPLVRVGNVAMIPGKGEQLPVVVDSKTYDQEVYLIVGVHDVI